MLGKVWKFLAFAVASFFGVGYAPFASGTFGSLAGVLCVIPIMHFYGPLGLAVFIVGTFVLGTIATKKVLQYTEHDPSLVVIDEVCGQAIAFLPLTLGSSGEPLWLLSVFDWFVYCVPFVLFRIFDIRKPLFIGWIDRNVRNAFGVMLDDVVAGICAALWFVVLFFVSLFSGFAGDIWGCFFSTFGAFLWCVNVKVARYWFLWWLASIALGILAGIEIFYASMVVAIVVLLSWLTVKVCKNCKIKM